MTAAPATAPCAAAIPADRGPSRRRQALLSTTALGTGALAAVAASLALLPPPAQANPQGGRVVRGAAEIAVPSAKELEVRQGSERAVINWNGFSIARDEVTRFRQPSRSSVTLNRVTGSGGDRPPLSEIAGRLEANGNVMLVNPSGVVFTGTARVDVGGLLASTADIDDDHFMTTPDPFRFTPGDDPGAVVRNEGEITVAEGGLAALVAPHVANSGTINARLGRVALASGEAYTLDLYGDGLIAFQAGPAVPPAVVEATADGPEARVSNAGRIAADGGVVALTVAEAAGVVDRAINMDGVVEARAVTAGEGGRIVLHGDAGAVRVAGRLDASGPDAGAAGGEVKVLGREVTLAAGAEVDVSGAAGGGTALVGGAFQGRGPEPNAATTVVEAGAAIDADAVTAGDGGTVVVWADGATAFRGAITARGGVTAGDGGLIETSGKQMLDVTGSSVDASAAQGRAGTWLLDPSNVEIVADDTGSSFTEDNGFFAPSPGLEFDPPDVQIPASRIVGALNRGTNVTVVTTSNALADGDITVSAPIAATGIPGGAIPTVRLEADDDLAVFAPISANNNLDVELNAKGGASGGSLVIAAPITSVRNIDAETQNGNISAFSSISATGEVALNADANIDIGTISANRLNVSGSRAFLSGDITTAGDQTYEASEGGAIFYGNLTFETDGGDFIVDGPARLEGGTEVNVVDRSNEGSQGGSITFNGPVDGTSDLTLVVGADGFITIRGPIGGETQLGVLTLRRLGGGDGALGLSASSPGGNEDSDIPITIGVQGSPEGEEVVVTISGVPPAPPQATDAALVLPDGTVVPRGADGAFTFGVPASEVDNLTVAFRPVEDSADDPTLTVGAEVEGAAGADFFELPPDPNVEDLVIDAPGGVIEPASAELRVPITAVADEPVLGTPAGPIEAEPGEPVPLAITAASTDIDGSEAVEVTLSALPAGSEVRVDGAPVAPNADGSFTVAAGQLGGLAVVLPEGTTAETVIRVTATAIERENADTASVVGSIIIPPSDEDPIIQVSAESRGGNEDTDIPLLIAVDTNAEGDPVITITINPAGATLSAGQNLGGGVWQLTEADLDGLTLRPVEHSDVDLELLVRAAVAVIELEDVIDDSATVDVAVEAVADAPAVTVVSPVEAAPGEPAPLDVDVALVDADGSESIQRVTVSGVPAGAEVRVGGDALAPNPDGSFTVAVDQLGGLAVVLPEGADADFTVDVAATSVERANADTATAIRPLVLRRIAPGIIEVVASSPGGLEDTDIPLLITFETNAEGERTITIRNLPVGATLSAGQNLGGGVWELSEQDLAGLTLRPVEHSDDNLSLLVEVAVALLDPDGGGTLTGRAPLPVAVEAVADAPAVTVISPVQVERGGAPAPLDVDVALVDTDGSESIDSIVVTGLPAGAELSAGEADGAGGVVLSEADLQGLAIRLPAGVDDNFVVDVVATSIEAANEDTASTLRPLGILVVPGEPGMVRVIARSPGGLEDTDIPLLIEVETDTEGGERTITVRGVPEGASLSAGADQGGGVWVLGEDDLPGLTLRPAEHSDQDVPLLIEVAVALAGDGDDDTIGVVLDDDTGVTVVVEAVADAPAVTVTTPAEARPGQPAPLDVDVALVDTDGSESIDDVSLAGVPAGTAVRVGGAEVPANPDGSFTLDAGQLDGLAVVLPEGAEVDFAVQVAATSVEAANADTATTTRLLTLRRLAPQMIEVVASSPGGPEDTAIPLVIAVETNAEGEPVITIAGVPAGASLSAGEDQGGGVWQLSPAQLAGLTVTPAADDARDLALAVEAAVTLGTAVTVDGETTTLRDATDLPVAVTAVADAATLEAPTEVAVPPRVPAPGALAGVEAATPDADGSETVEVVVDGLPEGATLSAGTPNPDGSFTVPADEFDSLTVTVPAADDARLAVPLTLQAVAVDVDPDTGAVDRGPPATAGLTLRVVGVQLAASSPGGLEDQPIPLVLTVNEDAPAGELAVTVSNVPDGAVLSAGEDLGGGVWLLDPGELEGLTVTPAEHASTDLALAAEAALAIGAATLRDAVDDLPVAVAAVADEAALDAPEVVTAPPRVPTTLDIGATTPDADGSEEVEVTIRGLPEGATLSAGTANPDGSFTVPADELAGLTLTVPAADDARLEALLAVEAVAVDTDPDTGAIDRGPSATAGTTLRVIGIRLAASSPGGLEDEAIPLVLTVNEDAPAGEAVFTVRGVPQGATLSAGRDVGGGVWELTPGELAGLTVTPTTHDSTDLTLGAEAALTIEGTTLRDAVDDLPVTVLAVTDPLALQPPDGLTVTPRVPTRLGLGAATPDADGSEQVGVTIRGLPEGATLSAGTPNPDGSFTVPAESLDELTLTVPLRAPETLALTADATARDVDPETGSVAGTEGASAAFEIGVEQEVPDAVDGIQTERTRLASTQDPAGWIGRGRPARLIDTTPLTGRPVVVDVDQAGRPIVVDAARTQGLVVAGSSAARQAIEGETGQVPLVGAGAPAPEGGDAAPTAAPTVGEDEALLLQLEQVEACPDVVLPTVAWQNTAPESAFNVDPQLVPHSVDVFCAGYKVARPGRGALVDYEGMTFVLEDFWTDLRQARMLEPSQELRQLLGLPVRD